MSDCDFENYYLAFKFWGDYSQPTQPPSTRTAPNTSCKYFNLIFPSIFLQVAAPPHSSFNISTLKFPQRLYLLKLQVGPKALCLLFSRQDSQEQWQEWPRVILIFITEIWLKENFIQAS